MPSKNMNRYAIDIYKDADNELQKVVNEKRIPRSRFFRECVYAVMKDPTLFAAVINACRKKNYIGRT